MTAARIVVAIALTAGVACGPEVAATIDGEHVQIVELRREIETMLANTRYVEYIRTGSGGDVSTPGALRALTAQVLTLQLSARVVDREIDRRKVKTTRADREKGADEASAATGSPSTIAAFPSWYRNTLVERASKRVALRRVLVEGVTLESYYREHVADFVKPCVHHLVVETRTTARDAQRRMLSGDSFAAVARDVSIDEGSAPDGGDLGCNGVADLLPELNEAVRTQPIGRVGDPIEADGRWHLILVDSRDRAPLGRVMGEVEGAIAQLAKDRLEDLVIARLQSSDVTVAPAIGRWTGSAVVA